MQDELWRVGQLGLGLFLVSSAINCQGYIEISVLRLVADEGDAGISENSGYYSLAINYLSSTLLTIMAPFLIGRFGAKLCLALGALCQSLFLLGFLKITAASLYILSALLGAGGALLWTSNGSYLVRNSTQGNLSRNSSLMWIMYQMSQISCALFLFVLLVNKDLITSYHFAYTIFATSTLFGSLIFASLPEKPIENPGEIGIHDTLPDSNSFKITISLLLTKEMQYLLAIFAFIGIETSFLSSIYTACLAATLKLNSGKEVTIAYSVLLIGIGEIFGGLLGAGHRFLGGLRGKRVVFIGSIAILMAYNLCFLNLPAESPMHKTNGSGLIRPNLEVSLLSSFLIGFGDSCWQTQVYPLIGVLYPGSQSASAFALQQFILTLSSTMPFFYGSLLKLYWQLLIGLLMTILATISFIQVNKITENRLLLSDSIPIIDDQETDEALLIQNVED